MANLNIENLPDRLYLELQKLATKNQKSLGEQVVILLENSLENSSQSINFFLSPDNDPNWEIRCKNVPNILAEINQRLEKRNISHSHNLPDSTILLRGDRER